MWEFVKNIVSKESAFRAVVGSAGAIISQTPDLVTSLPTWVGPVMMFMALLVKAGDKNPE
jgi:hypothetical protein